MNLPAQYAKFIAAVIGEAIAYVQLYGTTWHLEPALVMAGAALAVLGVPNAPKTVMLTPLKGVVTAAPEAPQPPVTSAPPA